MSTCIDMSDAKGLSMLVRDENSSLVCTVPLTSRSRDFWRGVTWTCENSGVASIALAIARLRAYVWAVWATRHKRAPAMHAIMMHKMTAIGLLMCRAKFICGFRRLSGFLTDCIIKPTIGII